jgi:hypothetical protein
MSIKTGSATDTRTADPTLSNLTALGSLRYIEHMNVKAAIEGVYAAFSDAQRPASVDGCPCCMSAEQYETLTAKPLRDLTSADLDEYASDALLTMGSG